MLPHPFFHLWRRVGLKSFLKGAWTWKKNRRWIIWLPSPLNHWTDFVPTSHSWEHYSFIQSRSMEAHSFVTHNLYWRCDLCIMYVADQIWKFVRVTLFAHPVKIMNLGCLQNTIVCLCRQGLQYSCTIGFLGSSCIHVLLATLVVGVTEVTLPTQVKSNNISPVYLVHAS